MRRPNAITLFMIIGAFNVKGLRIARLCYLLHFGPIRYYVHLSFCTAITTTRLLHLPSLLALHPKDLLLLGGLLGIHEIGVFIAVKSSCPQDPSTTVECIVRRHDPSTTVECIVRRPK